MTRLLICVVMAGLLIGCGEQGGQEAPTASPGVPTATGTPASADTAVATATQLSQQDRLSVAAWAAAVCAGAQTFADAIAEGADGIDSSTLSVEERKERSVRIDERTMGALEAMRSALQGVEPPPAVTAYHEALLEELRIYEVALNDVRTRIAAATTAAEIEAANATIGIAAQDADAIVAAASAELPPEAVAALRGVNRCGSIAP